MRYIRFSKVGGLSMMTLFIIMLLSACGTNAADNTATPSPTIVPPTPTSKPIDVKAKLQSASDQMAKVKTMHLTYSALADLSSLAPQAPTPGTNPTEGAGNGGGDNGGGGFNMGGFASLGGQIVISGTATADVANKATDSSTSIQMGSNGAQSNLTLTMRTIDTKVWLKDFISDNWVSCGGEKDQSAGGTGAMMCQAASGFSRILQPQLFVTATQRLQNAKFIGTETLPNGMVVNHISGDFSVSSMMGDNGTPAAKTAVPSAGTSVGTADLWIGDKDNYLYKLQIKGDMGALSNATATPGKSGSPLSLTVELSDFDKPVNITPPVVDAPAATATAVK